MIILSSHKYLLLPSQQSIGEIDSYGCYIYDPIEDRNNSVPCNFTTCEKATVWEEERADIFVPSKDPFRLEFDEEDLFTGCYFGAGWSSYYYSVRQFSLNQQGRRIQYSYFVVTRSAGCRRNESIHVILPLHALYDDVGELSWIYWNA